jgi:copper chaperone
MSQEHITLKVGGMTCMGCVGSVKRLVGQLNGVSRVDVDLASGLAEIDYDPAAVDPATLRTAIIDGGYQVLD